MYDEDLKQGRQALGDGKWEEARSFYARFSQKVPEARPVLLLCEMHDAKEAKDADRVEIIAGQLRACLEEFEEFDGEFIRAFCPQVLPCLMPNKINPLGITKEVHVEQWLLSMVACNIVLNYCENDEVSSLPEPEQRRICMTAIALNEYTFNYYEQRRGIFNANHYANRQTYLHFKKYKNSEDIRRKLLQVRKALNVDYDFSLFSFTNSSINPISPEAYEEYQRGNFKMALVVLAGTLIFLIVMILIM